jgi:hypothetical protein
LRRVERALRLYRHALEPLIHAENWKNITPAFVLREIYARLQVALDGDPDREKYDRRRP